jgi:cytidylate kinase
MKRTSLLLAGLVACLMLASVASASAMPTEENFNTNCTVANKAVVGGKVKVAVTGKNVAQSQARFAQCPSVKKVVNQLIKKKIEKPTVAEGFRCTPVLSSSMPTKVKWSCLFRGADTATEIRLKFAYSFVEEA